jgi:hypothetical protein
MVLPGRQDAALYGRQDARRYMMGPARGAHGGLAFHRAFDSWWKKNSLLYP